MAVRCGGSHQHLPWKVKGRSNAFAGTADEAEYPKLLCERWAKLVSEAVYTKDLGIASNALRYSLLVCQ